MAEFTYGFDPENSALDAVRLMVGDTDQAFYDLTDDEITWAIAQTGGNYQAASLAARTLQAKYARQADKTVGDVSIAASKRAEAFAKLAEDLTNSVTTDFGAPAPQAEGLGDQAFYRGQYDHPESAGLGTQSEIS